MDATNSQTTAVNNSSSRIRLAQIADRGLALAAAPSFAAMAGITFFLNDGRDAFCSPSLEAFHASGMVVMYMLMAVFHVRPWLRLKLNRAASLE